MRWAYLAVISCIFPARFLLAETPVELCPGIYLISKEKLLFSDSEKHLICGDPHAPDWETIPRSQAIYSLKNFLQDRGYYFPEALQEGEKTTIDVGNPTLITGVSFQGAPDSIEQDDGLLFVGQRLTPRTLGAISARIAHQLSAQGYPCPEIDTRAYAKTGAVEAVVTAGTKQNLVEVKSESVPGLAPGVLRRYDAFVLGKNFNRDLLPLTAQRTVSDGIVHDTYFDVKCTPRGAVADQKVLAGPPRKVTLGAGINTDRGLVARATWHHARLGSYGSQFDAALKASFKGFDFNTEELRIQSNWYLSPSRWYLHPVLYVGHISDNRLDILTSQIQLLPSRSWDTQSTGGLVSLGPSFNMDTRFRGVGRTHAYSFNLLLESRFTSHDFEWYRTTPRSGFEWLLSGSFSRLGILSDYSSKVVRTRYTHLLPLFRRSRHPLILGVRTGVALTLVPDDEGGLQNLTPGLRNYLGGTGNLRGFSFQELPDATGALSTLFLSLEARWVDVLPFQLQPFLFADTGTFDRVALAFAQPWFYSPGVGLRWQSPVGVFRTSLSHGYSSSSLVNGSPLSHWQFHITYGEEF